MSDRTNMADKSLEDTIKSNLAAKRSNRRPYRDQRVNTASTRTQYGSVGKSRYENRSSRDDDNNERRPGKLLISNLDYNVSEDDLKELYQAFGETKRLVMNYDRSGRSMGTAEVIYKNRADAMKAMQKYNGVPLDGKAMRLEVVNSGGVGSVSGGGRMSIPRMNSSRPVPYGGRGSRNTEDREPRKPREKKVEAKAEDLDAEMDAYFKAGNKKGTETVSKPDDNDDLLDERNDLLDASINEPEDVKISCRDNVVEADGDDDINLDEEL